ncbi:MAG: DUF4399 domain-containing protein [Proteobacteria bacterium]|nr:DUF4399 domain-containing protein [Pseudomonadota bacterium]
MPLPRWTAVCLTGLALIATLPAGAAEALHPWVVPPPNLAKEAYFSNLADGAAIETPFVLKFGLTGIGLATITAPSTGAGHHHLLVNRELPLDFNEPLPFNDQYIHFGKGQMETVLTFPPGAYTLRLVLADNKHIPNFVYSKPIHVTVTKKNADVDPKRLVVRGVALLAPRDGSTQKAPLRVEFHASGYNVSSTAVPDPGTGHFRLHVTPDGGHEETMEFGNGHTEVWLNPPAGHYSLKLDLMDNNAAGKVLATSTAVGVAVEH